MRRTVVMTALVLALAGVGAMLAQEGHPLDGTWHGEWGTANGKPTQFVVFLKWSNRTLTGVINPGRDPIPITSATLNPDDWGVRLEAETRENGNPVPIVIEGHIDEEDIGSYNRVITGTWTQGAVKGEMRMRRD